MKLLISIICVLSILPFCYSQNEMESNALLNKAKLMTLSKYGYSSGDSIIQEVLEQNASFLHSPSSNLFLVKVDFDQRKHHHSLILGDCSYYVAYNVKKDKFYRLGGFDIVDMCDFFSDLQPEDQKIYDLDYSLESEVDFYCLSEFNDLSKRKKSKKGFHCFPKCSNLLFTELEVSKNK